MNKDKFRAKYVNKIIHGKCITVMREWPDNVIDTIITDPPYMLSFMGKDWDKINSGRTRKQNELTAIAKGPESYKGGKPIQKWYYKWAKEVLRVAKPGAFLFAFGGTRTHHRLMCGLEDAGWEIRDCIMWLYGSGFPKSHNVGNAIDKLHGCSNRGSAIASGNKFHPTTGKARRPGDLLPKYEGRTPEGKTWDSYGTALKPSYEPIIVAMKPLDGTFAHNAEKHGVGGLWIDGGRIETSEVLSAEYGQPSGSGCYNWNKEKKKVERTGKVNTQGRWPANVILDEESSRLLDEQSGTLKSGKLLTHHKRKGGGLQGTNTFAIRDRTGEECNFGGDSGGASRFFYTSKSSKSERERENEHPTVKPVSLMTYLCKLTQTPTGGIVLDPFGGSGTTALACIKTGRDYIVIEKKKDYCKIARERVKKAKVGVPISLQRKGFKGLLEE